MVKVQVSKKRFDEIRAEGNAKSDVCYVIEFPNGGIQYAWSDDGEGFFFYSDLIDLKAVWG